jgi:ketosteroid isomerase-like protein
LPIRTHLKMGRSTSLSEQRLKKFEFVAFKDAFERKDAARWVEFYAEDAQWIEYKPSAPPRAPIRMIGKSQIEEFVEAVSRSNLEITLADEVVGEERAAFSVTCTFPDGRRVYEQVIVQLEDAKIARQVDVEAWD